MLTDNELVRLYETSHVIAVVGLSADPGRPSHQVAGYLKRQGFQIVGINPKYANVLESTCYSDLVSAAKSIVPATIDVVDIFRRPELVGPHVDEAIRVGARVVWMQEGIENEAAAVKARTQGLTVEMNRCLMKEHQRLVQHSSLKSQTPV